MKSFLSILAIAAAGTAAETRGDEELRGSVEALNASNPDADPKKR